MRWTLPLLLLATAPAVADTCGSGAIPISQVQGSGTTSPLAGQQVTVEGIVTLDTRYKGGFRGFYLQQADAEYDDDPATSEALFIYTSRTGGQTGHRVRVSGKVKEHHGLTELTQVHSLSDCGPGPLPEAVTIALPWPADTQPEHLENMRVRVNGRLTVIDSYNLARFGELTLAPRDQPIPTQVLAPGPRAVELQKAQEQQRLLLDDARGERDPRPVPWPAPALAADNSIRAGDQVDQLQGVLDYRFGAWRLQPGNAPRFHATNHRPPAPPRKPATTLRVLSLNLENYFNGDGSGGGFPTPRGARTADQFARQTARLVAAIAAPDPDILAVTELENDGFGPHSAIAELASALGEPWRAVTVAGQGSGDAIRPGLLYRADRVNPEGDAIRATRAPRGNRWRPPIAQVFRPVDGERSIRIVVAHFKSKSCRGASGQETDRQDGQGCYANSREASARALAAWTRQLPAPVNLAGTLATGDLNSYARERPLQILAEAGFTNMVEQLQGPNAHSYRFKGRWGTLDYSLASEDLKPLVTNATTWSINADEPPALHYQGAAGTSLDLPYRSSDHDPVITDFRL